MNPGSLKKKFGKKTFFAVPKAAAFSQPQPESTLVTSVLEIT